MHQKQCDSISDHLQICRRELEKLHSRNRISEKGMNKIGTILNICKVTQLWKRTCNSGYESMEHQEGGMVNRNLKEEYASCVLSLEADIKNLSLPKVKTRI
ncbi:hypothetical protein PR048_022193 [Dryococelus australis]|uniref:Uncharacterized protein n=1 Tax=Dryococelus australis TaxID=614101 RepID=A0ABQ9H0C4_9NEOP|nr:hypothetical protein PR048_022193 [Dryococelus australis]